MDNEKIKELFHSAIGEDLLSELLTHKEVMCDLTEVLWIGFIHGYNIGIDENYNSMDVCSVARKCKELIENKPWATEVWACSTEHCIDMCNTIINEDMEVNKANRWIGWLQSCMCVHGITTLDELKEMNKASNND